MITIYETSTGRILRNVSCSNEAIQFQCHAGESFLDGYFGVEFYVNSESIAARLPTQPSPHHIFNYTTKQWEDPRTPETEWPLIRAERDRLLLACDWTQLPDVPLATKAVWASYRQALRDITLQSDPFNITWPTSP